MSKIAYKGFDANLQCRSIQYAVGETVTIDDAPIICERGLHACEYPLDVFAYYPPPGTRFAVVEVAGKIAKDKGGDSKIAASSLTVKAEIGLPGLIKAAIEYTTSRAKPIDPKSAASSTGNQGAASSTGYQGAASSTGYRGAASSTGDQGAASSTGYRGAASSTGYRGAASSTGNQGAASSTGDQGAASSTGDQGAASSTGYRGAASSTGYQGAAMSIGFYGRVMGANGNALFLVERGDNGEIIHAWAGIVGKKKIKAGVWYTLTNGKPTEVNP
jgi:hypothetical protein